MKRTLLAAVIGGMMTLVSGAFAAQAAPVPAMKAPQAETNLTQTVGYGYHHRRHYHRPYVRPYVRYYAPRRYYRPYYVAPRHYYYAPRHRHWSNHYYRRHYR